MAAEPAEHAHRKARNLAQVVYEYRQEHKRQTRVQTLVGPLSTLGERLGVHYITERYGPSSMSVPGGCAPSPSAL